MEFLEFEWDGRNIEHGTRRFTVREIDAVLDGRYSVIRNGNRSTGEFRIIGRGRIGQLITVVVIQGREQGSWRVITAWPADAGETARARRENV